jgi:cystathionine beta-lyase
VLQQRLAERLPGIKLTPIEGTFLAWLDFRSLELTSEGLERLLAEEGRIALNAGHWFGKNGAGFARFNIACPRSMLEEGIERLVLAVQAA